jgi:hypothetical protein
MKISQKKYNRGEAAGDLVLVVSIVLALGALWVFSGGPEAGERGDFYNPSSTKSFISSFNYNFVPISRDSVSSDEDSSQRYDEIFEEYGRTRDFGETSPYWGLVTIDKSSRGPRQTSSQDEYITLNVSSKLTEPITITGWKLQSMISNDTVAIPEATKVSTSGNVNIEQPIVVSSQDKIYLLTGRSPIGSSFQINKCSGYFEQFQNFTPSISKQCPLPVDEFVFAESDPFRFGDECLAYIENLDRCYMPLEALPIGFSSSCTVFITRKINYTSCVSNHRDDEDFFKPEWRVYLKRDQEVWNTRDIIRLLDNEGKTVDVFSY